MRIILIKMITIENIYKRFPTKEHCISHLEEIRWGMRPLCAYCNKDKVSRKVEKKQRSRWQCSICKKSFSVTVGTIFHNSHVDLQCWFFLVFIIFFEKKMSIIEASNKLKIRRSTVSSMMLRIKNSMNSDASLLSDIVNF